MATPKKNAKDFSEDAESGNLNAKSKSSGYDEEADDFESLQMDELDTFDTDFDEDDD